MLPATLSVDTYSGDEELPVEVDRLEIIGGNRANQLLGEVRVCPHCGTYYLYNYDHDVTTGAGIGFSDHALVRVSPKTAADHINQSIRDLQTWIPHLEQELREPERYVGAHQRLQERIHESQKSLDRLLAEQKKLTSLGN